MDSLGLFFALILLVLPGLQLAELIIPRGVEARFSLIAGYGLLAGLLGVPLLMRLVDILGLPVSLLFTAGAVCLTVIALLATRLALGRRPADLPARMPDAISLDAWGKLLVVLLLVLMAVRVMTLGMELVLRPLFPWDATMHWATKARVWFDHNELIPFVDNVRWLGSPAGVVYTDYHPDYPITIPLLQLWMNSALGQWNESLMNLPWLICFAGLGFAFYGQCRQAGLGVPISLAFTYGVLSMPLLNTHVALAGYADLFLGAAYCLAVMAFYNWSANRQIWQAFLALGLAFSCLLVKNEGLFWMSTFFPALAVVLLSARQSVCFFGLVLAAMLLVFLFVPSDLEVAGQSLGQLNLYYRPGALEPVFESLFIHGSWHLFACLLVGLMLAIPWLTRLEMSRYAGVATILACAATLFLCLFVFTRFAGGDSAAAAVGRIGLQLVPSFMFFCALLCCELVSTSSVGDKAEGLGKVGGLHRPNRCVNDEKTWDSRQTNELKS